MTFIKKKRIKLSLLNMIIAYIMKLFKDCNKHTIYRYYWQYIEARWDWCRCDLSASSKRSNWWSVSSMTFMPSMIDENGRYRPTPPSRAG